MALKRPKGPAGTLLVLEHSSKILKDNPWRDPHVRKLGVWLPPQYDEGGKRRFPVLYDLVGFTGSGLAHANWRPFGDNVPERAARLIREGKMGPAIIVFPDCFTALGGNQYVNSSAIGDYAQAESTAARSNSWAGSDNALRAENWRLIAHAREARGDAEGAKGALEAAERQR